MEKMLESLLLSFSSATDSLGVPLLKEEMTSIWEEQKRHINAFKILLVYTGILSAYEEGCGFLSARTPSCSPGRSRLVEAICLHLCDRYPQATTVTGVSGKRYTSRWRLIISAYSGIRARKSIKYCKVHSCINKAKKGYQVAINHNRKKCQGQHLPI
jgi:hypothetical protein